MRLENRIAIVTGASQGLGLAIARRLIQEGATVEVADIQDGRNAIGDWPSVEQGRIRFHQTDVRDYESVETLVESVVAERGSLDILVNNASVFSSLTRKPFHEVKPEDWERSLSVNVLGSFHTIKAAFPHMKAQARGKVINLASDAVFKGLPMLLDYVASKGAVIGLTRALARELGPHNIQVNAVAPGYTWHESHESWNEERNEIVKQLRCLPRTQTPEDVAGAIIFLASTDSDFVTGQTLVVDGGEVMN